MGSFPIPLYTISDEIVLTYISNFEYETRGRAIRLYISMYCFNYINVQTANESGYSKLTSKLYYSHENVVRILCLTVWLAPFVITHENMPVVHAWWRN